MGFCLKLRQLSNILCALSIALAALPSVADDFTSFIPGFKKAAPSRKLKNPAQQPVKKIAPKLTNRQQCIKGLEQEPSPEPLYMSQECAANLEEVKSLFPKQHKAMSQLAGTWGDFHVGDYEEQIYQRQQETGNYDNDLPLPIVQNRMNFKISNEGFSVQVQDFDKMGKLYRSEVLKVKLCSNGSGSFFLSSDSNQFPIQFKNDQCVWVGQNGKWSAQRKFKHPDAFDKSVSRPGLR